MESSKLLDISQSNFSFEATKVGLMANRLQGTLIIPSRTLGFNSAHSDLLLSRILCQSSLSFVKGDSGSVCDSISRVNSQCQLRSSRHEVSSWLHLFNKWNLFLRPFLVLAWFRNHVSSNRLHPSFSTSMMPCFFCNCDRESFLVFETTSVMSVSSSRRTHLFLSSNSPNRQEKYIKRDIPNVTSHTLGHIYDIKFGDNLSLMWEPEPSKGME